MPGLHDAPLNNIAMQTTGFVQLEKGGHLLGVNSSDGFIATANKFPNSAEEWNSLHSQAAVVLQTRSSKLSLKNRASTHDRFILARR
ncbi:MAG: hypothetical protein M2R45_01472 [Verrucomicrobia subdivision 3 bacterium]|nr:hypothetical protein [Limisphaerales bacterium]MCS1413398.1 hypothetical protein [Limisphaerales bacterium]